jgi:hypothetical protein
LPILPHRKQLKAKKVRKRRKVLGLPIGDEDEQEYDDPVLCL